MSTEDEVKNAVKEFWIKEDEYILLNSKELIAALPEHLLPPINYLPHFELTENQWIYRARPANASYLRGDARNLISNYTFPQKKYTQQGR